MQGNKKIILNEFGKLNYNLTNLVLQNKSFFGRNGNESKPNSEITTNNINNNGQEIGDQDEEKGDNFKQKVNEVYSSKSDKTENRTSQSSSENRGNLNIRKAKVKLNHNRGTNGRIITSTQRSLSSSAIYTKKKKEKNILMTNTNNISKLNFKKCDTCSNDPEINPNKNTGKTARGILFVKRKRKFIFNCLFVKNKDAKIKKRLKKHVTTSQNTMTRKSILGISKSLGNILFYDNQIKASMDTEKCKNKEKSGYEMVILFSGRKDHEQISLSETNNKEFINKILSSEFSKSSLFVDRFQGEFLKRKPSKKSQMSNENNYSEPVISASEPVNQLVKNQQSNHLKRAPDEKAISEILCRSDKSPLHSLLSIIDTTLSTNNTSDKAIDLTLSSDACTSSETCNQNYEKNLMDIDEAIEKLNLPTSLKKKLSAEPCSFSSKITVNGTEVNIDDNNENKFLKENQGSFTTNSEEYSIDTSGIDKITKLNKNKVNFIEKLLNVKISRRNKSLFSKNENTSVKSYEHSNTNEAIKKKNQKSDSPCVLVEIENTTDIRKQYENYKAPNKMPPMSKKDYIPVKLDQSFKHKDNVNKGSNQNNKNHSKIANFETDNQMENLVYSSFQKQYIPVTKLIHPNKDGNTTPNEIKGNPEETASNETFDGLDEKLSLINCYFFYECQQDGDNGKCVTIDDETDKTSNNEIQFTHSTDDENNYSTRIAFLQDFQINLQNSCSEGNKIKHITEILADKNMQKPFPYDDSLQLEVQFLEMICTRRLQEAKKLTQNSSTNENKDESVNNTPTLTDRIPISASESKQRLPENSFSNIKNENNTKVNFYDTENNDANRGTCETNSSQKDEFSDVLNDCKSDTNSWSSGSCQTTSEFSAQLSKQFKRDYIPVKGKRIKISEENENKFISQKVGINKMKSHEKRNQIYSNQEMSQKEAERSERRQNENKLVVNIFVSRTDEKDSKSPFNLINKVEEKVKKNSSKISVCISQDSSDEVQEDDERDCEEQPERKEEFQINEMPQQQKFIPGGIKNSKLKSEIPECKRALFPRIYSDFSIENKCNPVTYKYLLPNQP